TNQVNNIPSIPRTVGAGDTQSRPNSLPTRHESAGEFRTQFASRQPEPTTAIQTYKMRAAGGAESGSFSIGATACSHSLVADYPECLPLPTGIRVVRRGVGRGRRPLSRGLTGLEKGSKVSQEGLPVTLYS